MEYVEIQLRAGRRSFTCGNGAPVEFFCTVRNCAASLARFFKYCLNAHNAQGSLDRNRAARHPEILTSPGGCPRRGSFLVRLMKTQRAGRKDPIVSMSSLRWPGPAVRLIVT